MATMLIVYHSRTGNTEKLAEAVARGAREVSAVEVQLKPVEQTTPDDMLAADAVIMGSPVYFGTCSAELKKLLDESVQHFGKMEGKVGGAFTSSGAPHGGNETTVLDILKALMIHGMVVKGSTRANHYGAIAVGEPDAQALDQAQAYGSDLAELTAQLCGH